MSRSLPLSLPWFWGVLALVSALPREAAAQSSEKTAANGSSCEAVQQTESLRASGQYRAARAKLLECVNAQCGGDVRRRCATILQRLDANTPSIVVRGQLADGNDETDVTVSLENQVLATSLDGIAIPVDPGEHRLVLQRPGLPPVTQTVTIKDGEKFRAIDVQLEPEAPSSEGGDGAATGLGMSERWAIAGTLIGVGVVGLTTFTWMGLTARSDEKELVPCKPYCSEAKGDAVRARYWITNITGGIGVLAIGGATWLLLSSPKKPTASVSDLAGLSIVAGSDGAFASYAHAF